MYETINERLRHSFYQNPTIEDMLVAEERAVLGGRRPPSSPPSSSSTPTSASSPFEFLG